MRIEKESIQQPSHMSYKEYKKRVIKKKKPNLTMFISIFFVLLLIFLGFAKLMSPDVDIAIGDDNGTTTTNIEDDNNYTNIGVDNRLKAIQEEDSTTPAVSNTNETSTEPEEAGLVKIPEKTKKVVDELKNINSTEEEVIKKEQDKTQTIQHVSETHTTAPAPVQSTHTTSAPVSSAITARVVVGFYNTQAQADVARGILQESGLGVVPHIRPMGAGYTLQVGAYSSKESANNLANKLLMNNYPARVIMDSN